MSNITGAIGFQGPTRRFSGTFVSNVEESNGEKSNGEKSNGEKSNEKKSNV